MALAESVKAGKHMKCQDQGKSRSTAQNSFTEQTCSMEGAFPNHETVKIRKHSMIEMRSKEDLWSQSISKNRHVWVKLQFQIKKGGIGPEYQWSRQRREEIYGFGLFHNTN